MRKQNARAGRNMSLQAAVMACAFGMAGQTGAEEGARQAEDQTPTGKFLTASEVKPILTATKGNWIAVRAWEGQDLLYFTQLLSWRCGLYEIRYQINAGEMQSWPVPDCDAASYTPASIPEDADIYASFPLNAIEAVTIELLYDDLSTDSVRYERAAVMIP
ncbi:hypothetical protein N6L24_15200 [Cognatishimia sp. SS12]|uniref:hypothetical protein n=1 Tax=Cognatishimia sp. SS12 TaxID=2979465 RepID=UPI00232CEB0C|nr:hypothetical protein [Cognatishimia sp. SS12]MDC0739635.1 hypothetical protein [Cognatishimia sp. SS12]